MVLKVLQVDFKQPIPVIPIIYYEAIDKIEDEKKRKIVQKIICCAEVNMN